MAPTKARIKVEAVGNVFFDVSDADLTLVKAPTLPVGGDGPGHAVADARHAGARSARSRRASQRDYDATSTANVISTAGDAALVGHRPEQHRSGPPGQRHVRDADRRCRPAPARRARSRPSASAPATLKTYSAPISNDTVTLGFRQRVDANDALRTGTYSKTLTFTLSTTQP